MADETKPGHRRRKTVDPKVQAARDEAERQANALLNADSAKQAASATDVTTSGDPSHVDVVFAEETTKQILRKHLDAAEIVAETKALITQKTFQMEVRRIQKESGIQDIVIEIGPEGQLSFYPSIPTFLKNAYKVQRAPEIESRVRSSGETLTNFRDKVEKLAYKGEGNERAMSDTKVLETLKADDPVRYASLNRSAIKNALTWIRENKPLRKARKK